MRIQMILSLLSINLALTSIVRAAENFGLPTNFAAAYEPYSASLTLNNINFEISSPNLSSKNLVTISSKGILNQNTPIIAEVSGRVTGAEVADLNDDGCPEVYVYLNASHDDGNGSILAFASNKNISLMPIYLPALVDIPKASNGYQGQDEFAVVENKLMRRFPIGKTSNPRHYRQIQYRLVAGEAGWILKPERITEF
jgi:hypothetical protein